MTATTNTAATEAPAKRKPGRPKKVQPEAPAAPVDFKALAAETRAKLRAGRNVDRGVNAEPDASLPPIGSTVLVSPHDEEWPVGEPFRATVHEHLTPQQQEESGIEGATLVVERLAIGKGTEYVRADEVRLIEAAAELPGDTAVSAAPILEGSKVTSAPLISLRSSPLNPRKLFEPTSIAELAESILHKGLMQNLVVRLGDQPNTYEVIAGGRRLKALIRRGEARDAALSLGVKASQIRFLDLPFYTEGRYRQFLLSPADITAVGSVLATLRPHQIYLTGHLADPSSVQGLGFAAFKAAWEARDGQPWREHCRVWLYRGHQSEYDPHEIQMAIPMSPDQLGHKLAAVQKFQSHTLPDLLDGNRNRQTARTYDELGTAEYEAIEAFRRWQG